MASSLPTIWKHAICLEKICKNDFGSDFKFTSAQLRIPIYDSYQSRAYVSIHYIFKTKSLFPHSWFLFILSLSWFLAKSISSRLLVSNAFFPCDSYGMKHHLRKLMLCKRFKLNSKEQNFRLIIFFIIKAAK